MSGFGGFGSPFGSTQPAYGGFGQQPQTSTPFGNSNTNTNTTSNPQLGGIPTGQTSNAMNFGSSPNIVPGTASTFGQSSMFGSSTNTPFGAPSTGFGQSTTVFANASSSMSATPQFGAAPTNRFGSTAPAAPSFGSSSVAPAPAFGTSSFISAPAPSVFGAPASFAQQPFSASASPVTASHSTAPTFGSVQSIGTTPFGTSSTLFGTTSTPSGFPSAPVFGTSAPSAYPTSSGFTSAGSNNPFGSSAPAPTTIFGSSSNITQSNYGIESDSDMMANSPTPHYNMSDSEDMTEDANFTAPPTTTTWPPSMTTIPETSTTISSNNHIFPNSTFSPPSTSPVNAPDDQLAALKAKLEEKKKRLETMRRKAAESKLSGEATPFVPQSSAYPSLSERNLERFSVAQGSSVRALLPSDLREQADRGEHDNTSSRVEAGSAHRDALSNAVTLVGTCMYMCPDEELLRREREGDIQLLELPRPGELHPKDWTLRNTAVKRFRRSAADFKLDVPEWVRPPDVLEEVCGYLEEWVMERDRQGPDPRFPQCATPPPLDVYQFIWDRTRMIRKDFILQNYVGTGGMCDARAVRCHERIARWHTMCEHQLSHISDFVIMQSQQNIQELGQTMKTLNQYYDDSMRRYLVEVPDANGNETRKNLDDYTHGCKEDIVQGKSPVDYDGTELINFYEPGCGHRIIGKDGVHAPHHGTAEPEMRGLYILLTIDNDGGSEVLNYAARLFRERAEIYSSKPVQLALSIYKAKREYNYARFFSLLREKETPYLFACIMFKHVEVMRRTAFRIMSKTYGGRSKDKNEPIYDAYPLKDLVNLLCFEDVDEARSACVHYNITVKKVDMHDGISEEIVHWRHTAFKEPKDPDKGTTIPLRPRKMLKTIESKLNGATRLAVCRGQFSGDGATLSTNRTMYRNIVSLESQRHSGAVEAFNKGGGESHQLNEAKKRETGEGFHRMIELGEIEKQRHLEDEKRRKEEEHRKIIEEKRIREEQQRQEREMEEQRVERELEQLRLERERKQTEERLALQEQERNRRREEEEKQRHLEMMRQKAIELEKERLRREQIEKDRLEKEQRQREEEEERQRLLAEQERVRRSQELEAQRRQALQRLEMQQKEEELRLQKKWNAISAFAKKRLYWCRLNELYPIHFRILEQAERMIDNLDSGSMSAVQIGRELNLRLKEIQESDENYSHDHFNPVDLRRLLDLALKEPFDDGFLTNICAKVASLFDNKTSNAPMTILFRIAVVIPQADDARVQTLLELLRNYLGKLLRYGRILRLREGQLDIRMVFIDGTICNNLKGCDGVLFAVPFTDGRTCSSSQLRLAALPLGNLPRVILALHENFDEATIKYQQKHAWLHSSANIDHVYLISNKELSRESLSMAVMSACRALLETIKQQVSIRRVERIPVDLLCYKCISEAVWRCGSLEKRDDLLQKAVDTLSYLIDELEFHKKIVENWNWPGNEFSWNTDSIRDYFGNGVHLPIDWTERLSRNYVSRVVLKVSDSLNNPMPKVLDNLLLGSPLSVRDECKTYLDGRMFRRCLHRALQWRMENYKAMPDSDYVYLPQNMVVDIIQCTAQSLEDRVCAPPPTAHRVVLSDLSTIPNRHALDVERPLHYGDDATPLSGMTPVNFKDNDEPLPVETPEHDKNSTLSVKRSRRLSQSSPYPKRTKRTSQERIESTAFTQKLEALAVGGIDDVFIGTTTLSSILSEAPPLLHTEDPC